MIRRIRKVKYEPANADKADAKPAVLIAYEIETPKGTDEYSLRCHDAPLPAFLEALAGLRPHVEDICEFERLYCRGAEVRGVSFSYHPEAGMGATITILRPVATANSPLVVNTPFLAQNQSSETGTAPLLSHEAVEALEHLQTEAARYIDGERMQGDLFAGGEKGGGTSVAAAVIDRMLENAEPLRPKKGSGLSSVTLSTGAKSVTLEAR